MTESAPSRFRWLERGDGEPVMLLHGLMGWVTGLILTGSSGLFERTFTRKIPHRPTAGYVRSRMEEIFYDPSLVTPQWVESTRHTLTAPHLALRVLRAARAAKHHNVEDRLGDIRVPTLIVWGKEARIPNCGHAPMLEQSEAFDVAVSEWLIETGARRGMTGGRR